ncbi:hypothetical protein Tco_1060929 [Tanacetum coccineum]
MSLVNQDLFYLKYGNYEAKKYVPSLHKIHAFPFPEDDLEELNTRWAQQGHIKRQQKTRDDPEVVYSESKIIDVVRVQFDQGYRQEYMTKIVVKRVDGEHSEFTKSYYKYLQKNDIEDMYLMCINRLGMESYQQKVNLTIPSLTFFGIEKKKLLTITSDPVVGLIYENIKQEKRVMIIKEIPNFCDATLKRVLEKVKKFNLDVKYGYADPYLSDEDAEYMEFYVEYIQERLRHQDQMRRWESYVNGRPLE